MEANEEVTLFDSRDQEKQPGFSTLNLSPALVSVPLEVKTSLPDYQLSLFQSAMFMTYIFHQVKEKILFGSGKTSSSSANRKTMK